jgi:xanthine dehydrogenase accessory factor
MKDIAPRLREWQEQGKRFALGTLIKVDRSGPLPPGAAMALSEDGTVVGSVSNGCVEEALRDELQAALDGAAPKTVSYGIADEQGFQMGLACGGQLHVFVDKPQLPAGLFDEITANKPLAVATVVSGSAAGGRMVLPPEVFGGAGSDREVEGATVGVDGHTHAISASAAVSTEAAGFADPELRSAVATDAKALHARQLSELRTYPQGDVFIQTFAGAAEMYVFGAADFSGALATLGKFLGFRVTVIDPRPAFATKERFPSADQVVVDQPSAFLANAPIGPSTAICVLTHDPALDVPALLVALKTEAGYIGAMGAKRTNEERFRKLRDAGATDDQLARIHAPIGLDLGGKSPEETAVSIAAEILAVRYGKPAR